MMIDSEKQKWTGQPWKY